MGQRAWVLGGVSFPKEGKTGTNLFCPLKRFSYFYSFCSCPDVNQHHKEVSNWRKFWLPVQDQEERKWLLKKNMIKSTVINKAKTYQNCKKKKNHREKQTTLKINTFNLKIYFCQVSSIFLPLHIKMINVTIKLPHFKLLLTGVTFFI